MRYRCASVFRSECRTLCQLRSILKITVFLIDTNVRDHMFVVFSDSTSYVDRSAFHTSDHIFVL